jgi:dTDP-4-dehydrorhamnose reductase
LLTGANGQVGCELRRALADLGEVVAVDRVALDLSQPDSIRSTFRDIAPNIIVNAAAYTNVDKAETESELAMKINGVAPGIFAEEAKRLGSVLVHYSTDYIYDGNHISPYVEEDHPNPINVYGQTKLIGEKAVQASDCDYLIFRTSWIYGLRGKNFLNTVLRSVKDQRKMVVVCDRIGTPTWSRFVAQATALAITSSITYRDRFKGIYHLAPMGATSWFGFAELILSHVGFVPHALSPTPIGSSAYPQAAKRPTHSVLCSEKFARNFKMEIPHWERSLEQCLRELSEEIDGP